MRESPRDGPRDGHRGPLCHAARRDRARQLRARHRRRRRASSHRLLAAARSLRVLATSREPLGVAGEVVVPLAPLATPLAGGARRSRASPTIDAVRLFADRAAAVDPAFDDQRTQRRRRRLAVPAPRRPPARHRARRRSGVRARPGPDRRPPGRPSGCCRAMSGPDSTGIAACGRCSIGARHASIPSSARSSTDSPCSRPRCRWRPSRPSSPTSDIAVSDVLPALIHLVRCSLVVAEGTGPERRYRLLETVRQYGRDRLADDGDLDRCRDRHRDWVLPWAVEAAKGLRGDDQASSLDAARRGVRQRRGRTRVERRRPRPSGARPRLRSSPCTTSGWPRDSTGAGRALEPRHQRGRDQRGSGCPGPRHGQGERDHRPERSGGCGPHRRRSSDDSPRSAPGDQRAALYAALARCWTDVAMGVPPSYAPLTADETPRHRTTRTACGSTAILSSCLASTGDLVGGRLYIRRVIDDPRLDRDRHARGSLLAQAVDIEAAIGGDLDRLRGDARESLEIATEHGLLVVHRAVPREPAAGRRLRRSGRSGRGRPPLTAAGRRHPRDDGCHPRPRHARRGARRRGS